MRQELFEFIHERSWKARLVSTYQIPEIIDEIRTKYDANLIADKLYIRYLQRLENADNQSDQFRSVLIIAIPRPQTLAVFETGVRNVEYIIPPTYTNYYSVPIEVMQEILQRFEDRNIKLKIAELPGTANPNLLQPIPGRTDNQEIW